MKTTTREKIIAAGAEIIHRKGFHHTGIQEVLAAAGVPRGSFYFYFPSKEAFGMAVVEHFSAMFARMAGPILGDRSRPPLSRLERLLDFFIEIFAGRNFTCGCPVGNLAQEMGDLSPAFAEKLREAVDAMARMYAEVLAEAQAAGELPDELDPEQTAYFIIAGWHGALIRMKVAKSTAPLENHKRFVMRHLLRAPAEIG